MDSRLSRVGRMAVDWEQPPLDEYGKVWFHEGQLEAWGSIAQLVALICGSQSGKTVFLVYWLLREIYRRGPGDYMLVGVSMPTLKLKAIPEFERVLVEVLAIFHAFSVSNREWMATEAGILAIFGTTDYATLKERYCSRDEHGRFNDQEFSVRVRIRVGMAGDSASLESITAKGVVMDECGQPDFKEESFEALVRRCNRHRARMLQGTTPYIFNWLKTRVNDPYLELQKQLADPRFKPNRVKDRFFFKGATGLGPTHVVNFASWMNPVFGGPDENGKFDPRGAYEDIKNSGMPEWRFRMMYDGLFTKPAGAIYDVFNRLLHCYDVHTKGFNRPPAHWRRVIGIDFGPVNPAAVFVAIDPDSNPKAPDMYVYSSYLPAQNHTTAEHVRKIKFNEDKETPLWAVGGARSEDGWRADFKFDGLFVQMPTITGPDSVEVQIALVYKALAQGRLFIHSSLLTKPGKKTNVIPQLEAYSRELDDNNDPIPNTIQDKAKYHLLDALRYVVSEIMRRPLVFAQSGKTTLGGYKEGRDTEDTSV